MSLSKIEFAVQMTCESCVAKIEQCLGEIEGVKSVTVLLSEETVVVETSLPSADIQQRIESTGRRAVLKGLGSSNLISSHYGAAVAILGCDNIPVKGVIRFLQVDENNCVVDGTLDGLAPGPHGLHIHETGDITSGCDSVGDHYNPRNVRHGSPENDQDNRHVGDLGNIMANEDGRAMFRLTDRVLKVWDVIGRSIVVTEELDDLGLADNSQSLKDGNSGARLACGIIARSAGLFENDKRFCACDGVSLWEERDKPLAGPGRSNIPTPAHL